jgi:hypothetical protein
MLPHVRHMQVLGLDEAKEKPSRFSAHVTRGACI